MPDSLLPVVEIDQLSVSYRQGGRWLDAVRDVSLTIMPGQTYGLVGESGSGKSTLALTLLRSLAGNGAVRRGSIGLAGRDLLALNHSELRSVRQLQVKLVPQDPLSALNPSLRIGAQLKEALEPGLSGAVAHDQVLALLRMVRLADPERVLASYPHQLSGGMQQRVMIAMALGAEPLLLVLDEPTTNLDVTTEAVILDLLADLIRERNTSVLYVSHNLGVITKICDRVAVLYAGELVEDSPVLDLYRRPLHPYTMGLLNSVPRLGQNKRQLDLIPIAGTIPRLDQLPRGCIFAPRCALATEQCHVERPPLEAPVTGRLVRCHRWPEILAGTAILPLLSNAPGNADPAGHAGAAPGKRSSRSGRTVLQVSGLEKRFPVQRTLAQVLRRQVAREVRAVDGVDLRIDGGKTLGLVGESGSGKTTIARCVVGLVERSAGEITLSHIPLAGNLAKRDTAVLRHLQMVFQNPVEALNPYMTVGEALRRPLLRLAGANRREVDRQVSQLLAAVKLSPTYAQRTPGQLSGGERQRVAIARAFASKPELLIFDEPVSALDVSIQAAILNLLNELQEAQESAYLFISHDLAVVSYVADDVAVVYLGKVMESGRSDEFFKPPYHPYTEALLSAVPLLDPLAHQEEIRLEGDVPSPTAVPRGCPFHTRCPRVLGEICAAEAPPWQDGANGHRIYCHISLAELHQLQQPAFRSGAERRVRS